MTIKPAGWTKHPHNPLIGGDYGTCFDLAVLKDGDKIRMWFSWRPKKSIALTESEDGVHWSEPVIVLEPNGDTGWEDDLNRPVVVKRDDGYHMWYTGQFKDPEGSCIGYATSEDGVRWTRSGDRPVLAPELAWEKVAVMCPHVIWDESMLLYRMWYSGGEQYEPNAIGYATSADGIHWDKRPDNPIFANDPDNPWERHKTTACQVVPYQDGFAMFYVGFHDEHFAQIGLAWSSDGIGNWTRHPGNPIISPDRGMWDEDADYKPFAIYDESSDRWLLWYNGRRAALEQIGLAVKQGYDLGFE